MLIVGCLLPALLPAPSARSQTAADPALLAEINAVRAVDNHAHVMAVEGEGGKADEEYDAVPCGGLEFSSPPPMRLRTDNPVYAGGRRSWRGWFCERTRSGFTA